MAATAQTLNFDALLTTTMQIYRPKMNDNIFTACPFFWFLYTKGRKKSQDGGANILVPLMYGKNTTARSYSGYGTLDVTPQDGMTMAIYPWRYESASISISGPEERKNSGEGRAIALLSAKIEQAEKSLQEELNRQMFLDGTGNAGQDIFGLNLLVEEEEGGWLSDVAGINRTNETWWRNQASDMTGLSFATNGLNYMRTMYNNCSKGNIHPDLILSNQTIYEYYEKLLAPNERFTDMGVGDAGFQNLKFKGSVMMYDTYCPSQTMFFLTTEYFELMVDSERDFFNSPFQKPINQDAKIAQIFWYGNLLLSNSARQGRISDIDTA